jgi:hypothetical protein
MGTGDEVETESDEIEDSLNQHDAQRTVTVTNQERKTAADYVRPGVCCSSS